MDGGPKTSALARDTAFAAVMITCDGLAGTSLLVGAVRARAVEQQQTVLPTQRVRASVAHRFEMAGATGPALPYVRQHPGRNPDP